MADREPSSASAPAHNSPTSTSCKNAESVTTLIERRGIHCPKDHGNRKGSSWRQKVPRKRNTDIFQTCTTANTLRHELFADFDVVDEVGYEVRRQYHNLLSRGMATVTDHWYIDQNVLTVRRNPVVTEAKPQSSASGPRWVSDRSNSKQLRLFASFDTVALYTTVDELHAIFNRDTCKLEKQVQEYNLTSSIDPHLYPLDLMWAIGSLNANESDERCKRQCVVTAQEHSESVIMLS